MVRRALVILIVLGAALLMASGVALAEVITGGPGDDTLRGTNRPDLIDGQGGDDRVFGRGGDDNVANDGLLVGGEGDDTVFGGRGDDDLLGGKDLRFYPRNEPGSDRLYGQQGDDRMDGDRGADRLYGGPGDDQMQDGEDRGGPRDVLSGGSGDDALFPIQENPAAEDIVDCGSGRHRFRRQERPHLERLRDGDLRGSGGRGLGFCGTGASVPGLFWLKPPADPASERRSRGGYGSGCGRGARLRSGS